MRRIRSGAWVERDRDTHEIPGLSSASSITSFGAQSIAGKVLVPPVDTRLNTIIGTVAAEYGYGGDARPRSPLHRGRPDARRRRDSQQIQRENQPPPAG